MASEVPSGENASEDNAPSCSSSVDSSEPDSTAQICARPSIDAVASRVPSDEKVSAQICPEFPAKVVSKSPVAGSQSRTLPS